MIFPIRNPLRAMLKKLLWRRSGHTSLIEVRIFRENILHNFRVFKEQSKYVAVAPVLKSNAYGHGLTQVAKIIDREKVPFLCADSYFEGLVLRDDGIVSPLLIIGYTPIENILSHRIKNVSFGIFSLLELNRTLRSIRRRTKIHLKIDTGMHRLGIRKEEIGEAVRLILSNPFIELEGVYSHLADADTPNSRHTELQIETWNNVAKKLREEIPGIKYFHCAATAGSFYRSRLDANVIRLGIGLYGINTGIAKIDLRPALEMHARITSLRKVPSGGYVGYNATFRAEKEISSATIPAGYSEGIDRRLSNRGAFSVRGISCPIVGRVNMNITSIDVSSVKDATLDDDVTVISKEPDADNSIENIARICATIPYEILVHISPILRRVVI